MTRRGLKRWVWVAALVLASGASAQSPSPSPSSRLEENLELDPIELARAVDALGDDVVLDGLRSDATPAAIRATPYLAAPELALPPLVELAAGQDPWLAPLAMMSILEITGGPLLVEMGRREPADLAPVIEGLASIVADRTARADLRAGAALARDQLGAER